jgi:AcrR family transcriptional regulator
MAPARRPAPARRSRGSSRAAPKPRRRIRLDTDERRAQLLALGKQAFAERPYDDVSIDDIARAAGISKGLLYHYFPTKRDLYVAGLQEIATELVAKTQAIPLDLPPIDRLKTGIDAYLDHVSAHAPGYMALMRGGIGSDPEVTRVVEECRGTLIDQFFDKHRDSPLAPMAKHPMVRLALRGWIGYVEAATLDWLGAREVDRVALRDLYVQMLVAAMQAIGLPDVKK